jgi:DNA mismatch repair protein PMS2
LSSLCALGNLTVVTRTKNEAMATQLHFDHTGSIISQESKARPVGTTVSVSKLFESLPVRYKEFNKNIRREYSKLIAILHVWMSL